jgi:18S rRNA (guanine1575-N7)-methyltransferase
LLCRFIVALTAPDEMVMLMQVGIYERNRPKKKQKTKKNGKGKEWLLRKKDQMRRKGHAVPADTKYTGRKRKTYF